MMKTALVRIDGNLKIMKDDYFTTQKAFAEELRGNGFKVLKIWNKDATEKEVQDWELFNRK